MATAFLSTVNLFISSTLPSSSATSSSSSLSILLTVYPQKQHARRQQTLSKARSESHPTSPLFTRRGLSVGFIPGLFLSLWGTGLFNTNAAVLEADDDEELLEKVKKDRKKRLERQGVISSSNKETGYLQDLVYQLSKVGQAIDNNDLSAASMVLGGSTDTDWVQKANIAFTKLSFSPEEKSEVDTFNSSIASLISSVTRNDVESSKSAFVASASAFEKWTTLTGLVGQLKGL
ncbi:hypothetical protein SLE2022_265260 [Rubroshorea leprosula]